MRGPSLMPCPVTRPEPGLEFKSSSNGVGGSRSSSSSSSSSSSTVAVVAAVAAVVIVVVVILVGGGAQSRSLLPAECRCARASSHRCLTVK